MSSGRRISATAAAGVPAAPKPGEGGPPAWQANSQPTRLPLQKDKITIRDAKLSDAPALAALMCELGYETTGAEMRQRLKSILRDARYRTFVAEIDNKLCGMIGTLTHANHEHSDLSGKIIAVVVSKTKRRSGIGRELIAAAEKDFARRSVTRVTLTTRFEREAAHQFYEALGYCKTGFRFARNLAHRRCT
jgi:ribosomal protein S18 acetylase RimI-like enzyme